MNVQTARFSQGQAAILREMAALMRRRASERERETVKYHVVLNVDTPERDTVESMRSRMGLLNSAMGRVVAGSDDFVITMADYTAGCLELDVWTTRLRGIQEGVVTVGVKRVRAQARPAPRISAA